MYFELIYFSLGAGEGNGTPLQYSCLENPMDGGAWWAAVHGVAKSWTRLSNFTFTFHFHTLEKAMATHSSVLVWRIPGTGEPGGLPSMGSHRVGHNRSDLAAAAWEQTMIMNCLKCYYFGGKLKVAPVVRNPPPNAVDIRDFQSLGQEDPLEEEMATHPSILAWKTIHGQRSLVGCSLWGHKELDMIECTCIHTYTQICVEFLNIIVSTESLHYKSLKSFMKLLFSYFVS